jgi:hypothetical protein
MTTIEQKQKRSASNIAITRGATLWMTGENETTLYVKPNGKGYDWIMVSPTTGNHVIKQESGLEPEITERVRTHWHGFQTNQTKH